MLYRSSKSSVCKEFSCFQVTFLLLIILITLLSEDIATANEDVVETPNEVIEKDGIGSNLPEAAIQRSKPKIAIVIDDLGGNLELSERAIGLPPSVTLAFLPFFDIVPNLVQHATSIGHEVLIHMPMEPLDSSIDPGPHALRLDMSFQELISQIRWAFDQIPNAVGLNNHMGSRFTQDENAMATLIGELKSRDMIFLDSRTTPDTKGSIVARQRNLRNISRDVFLDNDRSKRAIEDQLTLAEEISRKNGIAVVIGHPYPETLSVLADWLADAESRGYSSVPITKLVGIQSHPDNDNIRSLDPLHSLEPAQLPEARH